MFNEIKQNVNVGAIRSCRTIDFKNTHFRGFRYWESIEEWTQKNNIDIVEIIISPGIEFHTSYLVVYKLKQAWE